MSLNLICGAACGINVTGLGTAANRHWSSATAGVSISTAVHRNGPKSYAILPDAGGFGGLAHPFPTGQTIGYFRGYFQLSALPPTNAQILVMGGGSGANFSIIINTSGVITSVGMTSPGGGPTLTTGVWYGIEAENNVSGNPRTARHRFWDGSKWIKILGGSSSVAQVATTLTSVWIGNWGPTSGTSTVYWTDVIVGSGTTAGEDYDPAISKGGNVVRYLPTSDGTHSFTVGDFGYNAAGADVATSATDVYTYINDDDQTSLTNFIRQKAIRSTGYVEVGFADESTYATPRGVAVTSTHHASGTTADTMSLNISDDGFSHSSAVWTNEDVSDTTIHPRHKVITTRPSNGGVWTTAAVNAITARWGYSTSVTAIPYLDTLSLEVEWQDPPTFNFAQAQAQIASSGTTRFGSAQPQSDINATSQGCGQTQADIKSVGQGYSQANTDIKVSNQTFAQSQADIKQITQSFAQSQSDIRAAGQGFAQAQADVKQFSQTFAQAQANIRGYNSALAQAQAKINSFGQQVYGQTNARITAINRGFGQASVDIKQTYPLCVGATDAFQSDAFDTGFQFGCIGAFGQVQTWIKALNQGAFGQSQADTKTVNNSSAQAQADIKGISTPFAQSQANIRATSQAFGQAQSGIKAVSRGYSQAQSDTKVIAPQYAQSQADIKTTSSGFAQSQAIIDAPNQGFAQAQAKLKAFNQVAFGQTYADIKAVTFKFGQTQADIKQTYPLCGVENAFQGNAFDNPGFEFYCIGAFGQTQADIKAISWGFSQVQACIKGNAFGQAKASVKVKSVGYGNAQSDIKATINQYGHAQARITGIILFQGNAQAYIVSSHQAFGQAAVVIYNIHFAIAQAGAFIIKATVFAQAQAKITQPHTLTTLIIYDRTLMSLSLSDRDIASLNEIDSGSIILILRDRPSMGLVISDRDSATLSMQDEDY